MYWAVIYARWRRHKRGQKMIKQLIVEYYRCHPESLLTFEAAKETDG
jgi:hypothetical protein